jgi:hypothetical protein
MQRETLGECAIGDWVALMDFPVQDWRRSPYCWRSPSGATWHFAFTEMPVMTEAGEEAGTDFVWIRCDPDRETPPLPGILGFRFKAEADPADRWKSE